MGLRVKPSVIDLVVLGLLKRGPSNAFSLAETVERHEIWRLVKISAPAIYKSCKRLYRAGLLHGEFVRSGEAPEKTIYTLTRAGEKHFVALMDTYSKQVRPFHLEMNSFVYNVEALDYETGLKMLGNLCRALDEIRSWLEEHYRETSRSGTFGARMVVKQYWMTSSALTQWCRDALEEYRRTGGT